MRLAVHVCCLALVASVAGGKQIFHRHNLVFYAKNVQTGPCIQCHWQNITKCSIC